jgi:hypothetical protein
MKDGLVGKQASRPAASWVSTSLCQVAMVSIGMMILSL